MLLNIYFTYTQKLNFKPDQIHFLFHYYTHLYL